MGNAKFLSRLLVRAGPTEWDRQGRIAGSVDLPLPEASAAAIRLASGPYAATVAAVLCGPEQASVAAAKAFGGRMRVRPSEDLKEAGAGLWEGMLETEVEQRYRSCYREWRTDPGSVCIPEGEPLIAAQARLVRAVVGLGGKFASDAQHVAVVVRPLAWGLLRCWAESRALTDLWKLLEPETGNGEVGTTGGEQLVAAVLVESSKLKDLPVAPRTATRARA